MGNFVGILFDQTGKGTPLSVIVRPTVRAIYDELGVPGFVDTEPDGAGYRFPDGEHAGQVLYVLPEETRSVGEIIGNNRLAEDMAEAGYAPHRRRARGAPQQQPAPRGADWDSRWSNMGE